MEDEVQQADKGKAFLTAEDIERNINVIYERVSRLEKITERLYHEVEAYDEYMPKLIDVLIRYFPAMESYRQEIQSILWVQKGFLDRIKQELQEHFKSHYSDKKYINKSIYKNYYTEVEIEPESP